MMKRILSIVFSVTILISLAMTTAQASEMEINTEVFETALSNVSTYEDSLAVLHLKDAANDNRQFETVSGELENSGDRQSHTFVVDHSVTPDIIISARASGENPGKLVVFVSDDAGGQYNAKAVSGIPNGPTDGINTPKGLWVISNQTGATVTYRVTVSAESDNVGYAVACGTRDELATALGGENNIVPVAKNIASDTFVGYIRSYSALLNGEGDWFRYIAGEGDTYIGLRSDKCSSLAFEIYDAETGLRRDITNSRDLYTKRYSTGYCIYTVQRGYQLEPGHEYYIRMYTTKPYTPSDLTETYDVAIGLPCIDVVNIQYASPQSYSLRARTQTTFRINVNEFSNLSRPVDLTIAFNTTSSVTNAKISSVIVTSPNGKSFPLGVQGKDYFNNLSIDFGDFLNDDKHVRLNGTWTITARSNSAISGLKFKLSGGAYHISCNDP